MDDKLSLFTDLCYCIPLLKWGEVKASNFSYGYFAGGRLLRDGTGIEDSVGEVREKCAAVGSCC